MELLESALSIDRLQLVSPLLLQNVLPVTEDYICFVHEGKNTLAVTNICYNERRLLSLTACGKLETQSTHESPQVTKSDTNDHE